jgi:AcrR family transcriptional regulator
VGAALSRQQETAVTEKSAPESPLDQVPVPDPLASLPETARELLYAAQRIIAEEGLGKLTLARLAEESGQNSGLVAYYFGNKTGLLERTVESIIHDECLQTAARVRDLRSRPRVEAMVSELRNWSEERQAYAAFFELLVHSLRHDEVRQRMVEMYRWYISLNAEMLEVDSAGSEQTQRRLRGIAQLLSAISDGMAIQALIGRDVFPMDEPFEALAFMLEESLPGLRRDMTSPAKEATKPPACTDDQACRLTGVPPAFGDNTRVGRRNTRNSSTEDDRPSV